MSLKFITINDAIVRVNDISRIRLYVRDHQYDDPHISVYFRARAMEKDVDAAEIDILFNSVPDAISAFERLSSLLCMI